MPLCQSWPIEMGSYPMTLISPTGSNPVNGTKEVSYAVRWQAIVLPFHNNICQKG